MKTRWKGNAVAVLLAGVLLGTGFANVEATAQPERSEGQTIQAQQPRNRIRAPRENDSTLRRRPRRWNPYRPRPRYFLDRRVDLDGDGIPNWYDWDIDGDGIVNWWDRFPYNRWAW
jgi:hypothetical protein